MDALKLSVASGTPSNEYTQPAQNFDANVLLTDCINAVNNDLVPALQDAKNKIHNISASQGNGSAAPTAAPATQQATGPVAQQPAPSAPPPDPRAPNHLADNIDTNKYNDRMTALINAGVRPDVKTIVESSPEFQGGVDKIDKFDAAALAKGLPTDPVQQAHTLIQRVSNALYVPSSNDTSQRQQLEGSKVVFAKTVRNQILSATNSAEDVSDPDQLNGLSTADSNAFVGYYDSGNFDATNLKNIGALVGKQRTGTATQ